MHFLILFSITVFAVIAVRCKLVNMVNLQPGCTVILYTITFKFRNKTATVF